MTTILTELQQNLGDYTQQRDEYLFRCPFCAHTKKKLSINIVTGKWKCWVCDARGGRILTLVKKMNLPQGVINQFKNLIKDTDFKQYEVTEPSDILELPAEYQSLWKKTNSYPYIHALTYLQQRGITTEDIFRYRMGYCESGSYRGRIIVPSYDVTGRLNYFTARSFYDGQMKYKNPPASKNTVVFENMVDWDEEVVLVEGMFDAIAVRRNAIPLMGKTISPALEAALLRNSVEKVTIFLDTDARIDALKLEHRLRQYDIETQVVLFEGKDASELGFTESWKSIGNATTTNFKQLIQHRLQRL
jgi:5S rRNA maturation endonuclease (ribonuclease M5)